MEVILDSQRHVKFCSRQGNKIQEMNIRQGVSSESRLSCRHCRNICDRSHRISRHQTDSKYQRRTVLVKKRTVPYRYSKDHSFYRTVPYRTAQEKLRTVPYPYRQGSAVYRLARYRTARLLIFSLEVLV